jgi:DNA modification methylase
MTRTNSHVDVVLYGDCRTRLREIPDGCVQTVVTSPPYWGLRDYNVARQIGLESTIDEYIKQLVAVFAGVRRTLKNDGTLWLNIGDSYNAYNGNRGASRSLSRHADIARPRWAKGHGLMCPQFRNKNLIGLPWMLAFALRADGWVLRDDIIWSKSHYSPERVKDRPTRAHEYIFLLTKKERYFYNMKDVRALNDGRNDSSVWTIAPCSYPGAHFATFPPELAKRCVRAGSQRGDLVLDPFAGSGTTLMVARDLGRHYIGVELNRQYRSLISERLKRVER